MSIKERLEKGPMDRPRTVLPSGHIDLGESYRKRLLELGVKIHREAGTRELFRELVTEIGPVCSDFLVITQPKLNDNGATSLRVLWNGRKSPLDSLGNDINQVSVEAYPTGDLVVIGVERELLESVSWRADPQLLEDAMARAYNNSEIVSYTGQRLGQ